MGKLSGCKMCSVIAANLLALLKWVIMAMFYEWFCGAENKKQHLCPIFIFGDGSVGAADEFLTA